MTESLFRVFYSGGLFRLIINNRTDVFLCAHLSGILLIYIKGDEPLMSDPSGTKMTTEYY